MNDLIQNKDTYLEHSQHILGESGKRVPFFRNMKTCSTCFSEREKLLKRSEEKVLQGRGWDYDYQDFKLE